MSLPRILTKVVFTGTRILGRALAEAGRQAVRNAQHRPEAAASASSNFGKDGSKSPAAAINNQHRMTLEEACLILNVKKDEPMDVIEKNYNTIFAANAPAPPPAGAGKKAPLGGSHYLQSKVFRALERIKAEKALEEGGGGEGAAAEGGAAAATEGTQEPLATAAPPPPPEGQPRPPPPENEPIATGPPPPSSGSKTA